MPNKHWRKSQLKDPFLVSAHQEHYRSRSYFELQQINKSQKIIRQGMNCIDLGSYPGGWSLYSRKNLAKKDNIFAVATPAGKSAIALFRITGPNSHSFVKKISFVLGSIKSKKPIGFGILTCNNLKQAKIRAAISKKNKGKEVSLGIISILKNK